MNVCLDLDRTLYRTEDSKIIWDALSKLYDHIIPEDFERSQPDFYYTVGDMYYHDFSNHLRYFGVDPDEAYSRLLASDIADGRLEYEGAKDLVSSLIQRGVGVRILTFGSDDYQRFKVALCPSLARLPVITTLEPKSEYFKQHAEPCWLVDDKPVGDELPDHVSFVQVSLEEPFNEKVHWPVFYSLKEVKEFFDETMH